MSRVLLLHLDGKVPNIALMRLAAHHKAIGDEVTLRRAPTVAAVEPELGDRFDRVYASAIFTRTRPVAERLLTARPDAIVGGTGWDLGRTLEDVGVTTKAQDYSIYPRFKPSIGFSQRGCQLQGEAHLHGVGQPRGRARALPRARSAARGRRET